MNIIYKIVGYTALCSSFIGTATSRPSKMGFKASEWVAAKAKVVCEVVENVAHYGKKASQWVDDKSTNLYNTSQEWIYAQDGYNHTEFEFDTKSEQSGFENDNDWVLITPQK